MTQNDVKTLLVDYLKDQVDVSVYKDKHPPVKKGGNQFIVVNVLTTDGKSYKEGYANVNWYVPDIEKGHDTGVQDEPDHRNLGIVETKLIDLFNHGRLLTKGEDSVYCTIDKTELIPDNFTHLMNLRLKIEITNY